MIKAETLKDLILNMGKQRETKDGDYTVMSFSYDTGISPQERTDWLRRFEELEKAGMIHAQGDNIAYRDFCTLWSGNYKTDYERLQISLFKDSMTLTMITKFSYE